MTTCAVMLARDEADIIAATVGHLLAQTDEVIVTDHRSTDGTREILEALPVVLHTDDGRGHWQERDTNRMAMEALDRGHDWVVPCDADEIWVAAVGGRLADFLETVEPAVSVVYATMFDHVPSAVDDPAEPNPVRRICWRRRESGGRKAACRLRRDLRIAQGNHSALYGGEEAAWKHGLLTIRHFSLRDEGQVVRKVRNGRDSYSVEAGLPPGHGDAWAHWGATDDEIVERFRRSFWSPDPANDETLVYDPAPLLP